MTRTAGQAVRYPSGTWPRWFVVAVAAIAACAPPPPGTVVAVHDGDTISVRRNHATVRVRLACIDAPERGQPFGTRAKKELQALVLNRQVHLDVVEHDRYGRTVARLFTGTTDINLAMVKRGLAWHYRHHCPDDLELAAAEVFAREHRHGLWRDRDPIPPWEWRRR